jgi:hypothetical protein
MKLSDLTVKNLAVPIGRRTFFDDTIKGFGVRVTPTERPALGATSPSTVGVGEGPLAIRRRGSRAGS